jgi:hypothetical protein
VLATFQFNSDLFSSHWGLVIGIGLAFFLLQVVLSISFGFRMRRQQRVVRRLCRNFESGGNGRGDRSLAWRFPWTHWVVCNFPADGARISANFTRDDALQELDTRIASNGSYLLLQRMSVMAPLLGVVLTVAGFYWLNVSEEDQSLQTILMAVTPLVSGVGTGAVLAIINQMLLHMAGRRVESLRTSARHWFDTVIWSRATFDAQGGGTAKAVQAMERLVRNALSDIDRLSETLTRAAEISVAISALPDQIRTILDKKPQVDHKVASTGTSGRFVTRLPARPR